MESSRARVDNIMRNITETPFGLRFRDFGKKLRTCVRVSIRSGFDPRVFIINILFYSLASFSLCLQSVGTGWKAVFG